MSDANLLNEYLLNRASHDRRESLCRSEDSCLVGGHLYYSAFTLVGTSRTRRTLLANGVPERHSCSLQP